MPNESQCFSIINIVGSLSLSDRLYSGLYSKDEVVDILYKLIPRWTLLYNYMYIITPFIGHHFLKPEKLVHTWLDMMKRVDPGKVSFFVRGGQLKLFKNAFDKINDTKYETLDEYGLGSNILREVKGVNRFHAKIYCGISEDSCEVFSGSANLVRGPSLEVMHFNEFNDYSLFSKRFLEPIGIGDNINFHQETTEWSLLFDERVDFDPFKTSGIPRKDYRSVIIYDEEKRD